MRTPRVAAIHDMSGFGRCSLTVAIPVLSAMGLQCCPLPTAFLSTHTGGFEDFSFLDMTDEMPKVAAHWKTLDLDFQCIYSGFLGSERQIRIVSEFIREFRKPDTVVVVDPVMGDHGQVYQTYTPAMCEGMVHLAEQADVIVPNLTEAAMMAGTEFCQTYDADGIGSLLAQQPCKQVLLTGVGFNPEQTGFALRRGEEVQFFHHPRLERNYHGTGDLFASAFVGALASGKDAFAAGQIASAFTLRSIRNTADSPAHWYGVKFEPALADLIEMLKNK